MSNISNRHNINPFVSGKSEALTGQRLAKIGYKSSKKQPAKYKSVCVSLPQIDMIEVMQPDNLNRASKYIRLMFESAQDGIVRSLYESSGGTLSSVSDEELSISNCLAFLESESQRAGRISKEFLESWFDSELKDNLTLIIAEKLGIADTEPEDSVKYHTLNQHLNAYKALIAGLAARDVSYTAQQIAASRKAIALAESNDDTTEKLLNKLTEMETKPQLADLLEL